MTVAKNLVHYSDIRLVIDTAISQGGAKYKLPTPGKAIHWRQRAYTFRKLVLREAIAKSLIPGFVPSTPYDEWEFEIDKAIDDSIVVIRRRVGPGELLSMDNLPLEINNKKVEPVADDDLARAAANLLAQKS